MLNVVEELLGVMAEVFGNPAGRSYDQARMQSNEIRALLAATPADAAERLADAERRVEKMRGALMMIRGGMATTTARQEIQEKFLKAVEEALE